MWPSHRTRRSSRWFRFRWSWPRWTWRPHSRPRRETLATLPTPPAAPPGGRRRGRGCARHQRRGRRRSRHRPPPGPARSVAYALGLPVTSPALESAESSLDQLQSALSRGDVAATRQWAAVLRGQLAGLTPTDRGTIEAAAAAAPGAGRCAGLPHPGGRRSREPGVRRDPGRRRGDRSGGRRRGGQPRQRVAGRPDRRIRLGVREWRAPPPPKERQRTARRRVPRPPRRRPPRPPTTVHRDPTTAPVTHPTTGAGAPRPLRHRRHRPPGPGDLVPTTDRGAAPTTDRGRLRLRRRDGTRLGR